jgi:hypothetical protein
MLPVLLLFAACSGGDATAPEGSPPNPTTIDIESRSGDNTPVAVRVIPSTVTLETNQLINFRAQGLNSAGDSIGAAVSWRTTGGAILPDGRFSAAVIGSFKVIGTNHARGDIQVDTATVVVVRRQPKLASIEVTPGSISLTPGVSQTFTAIGRTAAGKTVPIGVNWTAKGGAIDAGGSYVAGDTAGTYQVIAINTAGTMADTATVAISAPPTPPPPPAPPPVLGEVTVSPATATLAPSTTRQFNAFGRTTTGDSVAVDVVFSATGGTVTSGGLYTAGPSVGVFRVIASAGALADTSVVTVKVPLGSGTGSGVPYGPFGLWGTSSTTPVMNPGPFSMSINADGPDGIATRINSARALGQKLVLAMTDGNHSRYITDGSFDWAKWKARQDLFKTTTIKTAVAAGLADGTILGANVMDEPQHTSWNGSVSKPMLDQMAAYVKSIFPNLPVGVSVRSDWRPAERYKVIDFIVTQYGANFGSVTAWRDNALAFAAQDGVRVVFSINILNGGAGFNETSCPIPPTGGPGLSSGRCRMGADQVRQFGTTLGSAGSGLFMWQYDSAFMADPANVQAFKDVGAALAKLPAKSWRRP